jgi:hypothetical protein
VFGLFSDDQEMGVSRTVEDSYYLKLSTKLLCRAEVPVLYITFVQVGSQNPGGALGVPSCTGVPFVT